MNEPSRVFVQGEAADGLAEARRESAPRWSAGGIEVEWTAEGDARVSSAGEISRVALRWAEAVPAEALVLGDAWERSYGDLHWRHLQTERLLPWSEGADGRRAERRYTVGAQWRECRRWDRAA